jgi:hypothetical protein
MGALMTTGLVVVGFTVTTTLPVTAATEGSLRARAATVEGHLAAESAALHSNAIAYLSQRSTYDHLITAETNTRSRVRAIEHSVEVQRAVVRAAALSAYVNAGKSSPIGLYLDGRPSDLATSAAYARAANDHIASSIAALNGNEVTLSANLKIERFQVASAGDALAATVASRTSVLAAVNAERSSLSSLNGALAVLVQRQEIARQKAEADAAARAAAAAAAAASSTPNSGPPAVVGSPATIAPVATGSLSAAFAAIRRCESSGNYSLNTGNGYYGAYQFSAATWSRLGGSGIASSASPAAQDAAAYKLYQSSGWGAWPECAAVSGL